MRRPEMWPGALARHRLIDNHEKTERKLRCCLHTMKRILKMNRLRLRGIMGAKDEFLLTATAQNLRRMAKYLGTGPPRHFASAMA